MTTFSRYLAPEASQQLFLAGVLMYDLRPDRVGWTVYDIDTHRPVVLDGLVLTGLEHKLADELVSLLNRSVYAGWRRGGAGPRTTGTDDPPRTCRNR